MLFTGLLLFQLKHISYVESNNYIVYYNGYTFIMSLEI